MYTVYINFYNHITLYINGHLKFLYELKQLNLSHNNYYYYKYYCTNKYERICGILKMLALFSRLKVGRLDKSHDLTQKGNK